jgi:regulation of enolase protein 1 (concanavalin A-like superfamily)
MKKYFVNHDVTKQDEFTSVIKVERFLKSLADLSGVIVEIGRLENDEWISDKKVGGQEFLAGVR